MSAADDDLYDVLEEVIDLKGKWADIPAGLGLSHSLLSIIKMDHSTDALSYFEAVLFVCLSKRYNVGPPSWQTLVKAVADPSGGGDTALALKIPEKHPGTMYISH